MSLNPQKICFPGQSTSRRRLDKVERNKNGKKVESFTQYKFWLPTPDSRYPSTKNQFFSIVNSGDFLPGKPLQESRDHAKKAALYLVLGVRERQRMKTAQDWHAIYLSYNGTYPHKQLWHERQKS